MVWQIEPVRLCALMRYGAIPFQCSPFTEGVLAPHISSVYSELGRSKGIQALNSLNIHLKQAFLGAEQ